MTKFCTHCGATLAEGVKFCNKCGARIAPTEPSRAEPQYAAPPPQYQAPPAYQQPPSYAQAQYQAPAAAGLQQNVAGLLCYALGLITGIIFLVLDPYNKDRFVRFHAYQSIFLNVAWIVASIIVGIFSVILATFLPWFIVSLFTKLIYLGFVLSWLLMMYKAYNNETFKLPIIGDIAMKQAG